MKIIIIEDEKPAARRLQRMVEVLGLEVVTLLHSVAEAVEWFQNNEAPELLFLDIQLSDGLSFEIFEKVELDVPIIFTTAYDEFALKAFKLNSIDYLLKPIDEEELKSAVEKFKRSQKTDFDITSLKSLLQPKQEYKERFSIKIGQHIKLLKTDDIECVFSENKATYFHGTDHRNYLIDNSLEYWLDQLDPKQFYKVNRTFVVSINAIKDIVSYSNSRLQVKLNTYDEQEIIVSRERVKDFKDWIS